MVEFGFAYEYTGRATISIDYGDDKRPYKTSKRKYIDSAFWHEYDQPGFYAVTASLAVPGATAAVSSCSFYFSEAYEPLEVPSGGDWFDAMPDEWPDYGYGEEASGLEPPGSGDVGLCADGSLTSSAGRQGACSWHGGLMSPGSEGGGSGSTYVEPYFRSDGTYVSGHYRSR